MKGIAWGVAALLGCVLLLWSVPSAACGMAWGGLTSVPPKPADEQVLMVWDQKSRVEHFVRQVRFSNAKEPFGFVVPTPTLPTLQEIDSEPWDFLVQRCNPRWGDFGLGLGSIGTLGHGSGAGRGAGLGGAAPPPVTVLEEKQLGDFKAFVLEANDAKGFSAWLRDNQFKSTPELEDWLKHYIDLKFYFVALRYDGTKKQPAKPGEVADQLISKTVHISFKTPNPYYPYLEPLAKPGTEPAKERKLQVWLVSDVVMQPVARYWGEGEASGSLVRPWTEAYPCDGSVAELGKQLKGDLERSTRGKQRLQVFADLKTSREGYGDVLLVPTEPDDCTGDCAEQRDRLATLLERGSELSRDAKRPGIKAPEPYLAPGSCSSKPRGNSARGWLCLGIPLLVLIFRSRRRFASKQRLGALVCTGLLLAGCDDDQDSAQAGSSASGVSASVAATSAAPAPTNSVPEPKLDLPKDAAQAHAKLVMLLGGKLGGLSIPVQATDARTGIGAVTSASSDVRPSAGLLAARCTPGTHVEALIRVEIDHTGKSPIRVAGPISEPAKKCIAASIGQTPPDPLRDGTELLVLGFGPSSQPQRELQQRFARRFGFSGPRGKAMRLKMTDISVSGRLPKEVIQRIQRQNYGRFRLCAEGDKTLKELTINYAIDAEGHVKNLRTKPDGGASGVCIRKGFSALTFPKPEGGIVLVSLKLSFERPD